jgi:amino acid adenylation domain-containing protein
MAATGLVGISPVNGLTVLGWLLKQDKCQVGVLPTASTQWQQMYPAGNSFLVELGVRQPTTKGVDAETDVGQFILEADPNERLELLKAYLRRRVGQILMLAEADIPADRNVMELGLDSIMIMELITKLDQDLGLTLPIREFFERPSLNALAEYLLTELELAQRATIAFPEEVSLPLSFRPTSLVTDEIAELPPIQPVASEGDMPLSFSQQRLFFIDQLEPGIPVYNIPAAVRLHGMLDITALENSLNEIVRRHEALRTNFTIQGGRPFQVIVPAAGVSLPVIDLEDIPSAAQEAEVQLLINEEIRQPFDLAQDLKLRVKLLRLSAEENVLILTMHHIAADGWSLGIFSRELVALYEAFATGKPSPLPDLPVQYADYAYWQRQWLQREVLETQLSYWKRQLDGAPPILELPTDRLCPSIQTYHGGLCPVTLSRELSNSLKELSRREGVTLYMTLLAAFQALLYRYTGQADVIVGSPIAGRNRPEVRGLIGFFVNTLVMRTELSGNSAFGELLKQVRGVALDAYEHQDIPFEKLVEELQPERNPSHHPLFQVMFVLQNAPQEALSLPGLTVNRLPVDIGTAKFDLTLTLTETEESLNGSLEYNPDLFDASTIERMVGHFQTLLAGIVVDLETPVSQLPLLTAAERQELLFDWNDSQVDFPSEVCIHQVFEVQVARTPDAVAVIFEDQQLTYVELNQRANRLAHFLQSLGVKPEILIGVCMERSIEMVVAILAILKAGGAYAPIDPTYPKGRLRFMSDDMHTPLLLTQEQVVSFLPSHDAKIICVDAEWEVITKYPASNPLSEVEADNLAYVIYTSGSTGKPKGVEIPHRAISNHMFWLQSEFNIDQSDRILQKTPFSFDAAVWEFYAPLLAGGQLIMAQPEGHRDGHYLVQTIIKHEITILQLVPSQLQLLLATPDFFRCTSLRNVFCGGEPLRIALVNQLFQRLPTAKLHNLYGPSEATIDTTIWPCKPLPPQASVPIGRPIANVQTYILDSHLQPVPIGVSAELYIGGTGVGRGYLNRPELTSEGFIPDPFRDNPKARLYKTGDMAYYRADGNIEFLGRFDDQVKIRGFRIELGEIEVVLSQHPAVKEVVVLAREDSAGDKRLVAYFIPQPGQTPTINELRGYLLMNLPEYMVPANFIPLDVFPLTSNDKIDRRSLPVPDHFRPELEASFVAPRTLTEKKLAHIWIDLLMVEKIGIHDDFFELGGHSLLAIITESL